MKEIKKEFDEQFIQKGELSEPYLRQYEDRGSAPFYCSLCSMSEIEMSNNKTKDGRYFCDCSYWSEPHNAYVDKSGGKWLGWKDEKKALDLIEEITGIKASNELVNKIWDWFEPKLKKEREDAIKDIVKDIGNLKLKERKIDYSYVNIPEEWKAEPGNLEKYGYNQAVSEINNKIDTFITNNLSQTKGGNEE